MTKTSDTRAAMHRLAEHILSPARYAAAGRIGLTAAGHGIKTPAYDGRVLEIAGTDLLLHENDETRRTPITTLRAAGEFAGIPPGAPTEVYSPGTPCDLDAVLSVDPQAMQALADWYNLGAQALMDFATTIQADEPSAAQLWPEHMDLAISAAQINYGFSPGDAHHDAPYVYVGPYAGPPPGDFWNAPFGALRAEHEIGTVADALAFMLEGRRLALP